MKNIAAVASTANDMELDYETGNVNEEVMDQKLQQHRMIIDNKTVQLHEVVNQNRLEIQNLQQLVDQRMTEEDFKVEMNLFKAQLMKGQSLTKMGDEIKATVEQKLQKDYEHSITELQTFVVEKLAELDQKLLVKTKDRAVKSGENWHAELPPRFVDNPEKVQEFVRDEVYLQFTQHFKKLQN